MFLILALCRDVLNYLYFDKRCLYAAVVAKTLRDAIRKQNALADLTEDDIEFAYFKGDLKKPHIILTPNIKGWQDLKIRIMFVVRLQVEAWIINCDYKLSFILKFRHILQSSK